MADDVLNALDATQEEVNSESTTSSAYINRAEMRKKENETTIEIDGKEYKKPGRPATGIKRNVFSVSLETELIDEINQLSKDTGLTRTMITEKALNLFMEEQAAFYREMLGKK